MLENEAREHLNRTITYQRNEDGSTEIINDFSDDEIEMLKYILTPTRTCISCRKQFLPQKPTDLICPECFVAEPEGFKKFDKGKPKWSMLPFKQVEQVLRIVEFGAEKYGPNNWQTCTEPQRYIDAAFRHLISYANGDKKDEESGKSHLAHCACNLLFLMWMDDNADK